MSIRMPTASETRRTALAAGAKLQVCDDGLLLRDGDRLPKQILKSLQKHEQMIIEDVRANESMTSAEDMRLFRDSWKTQSELGGFSPPDSRSIAIERCIAKYLCQNSAPGTQGRCTYCKQRSRSEDDVFLLEGYTDSVAFLHPACLNQWIISRRSDAVAVMAQMGVLEASEISRYLELPTALVAQRIGMSTAWMALEDALRENALLRSLSAKSAVRRKVPAKRPRW